MAGVMASIVACASGRPSNVAPVPSASLPASHVATGVPNLYEAQRQVEEYLRSGRYDEEVAQVVATASA